MSEIKANKKSEVESIKNEILNICEPMCLKIIKEKPDDIVQYMMKYLRKNYNYTSSLLSNEEKKELSQLKKELQFFHEQEENIYFIDSYLKRKDIKTQDKKGRNTQKQRQKLPPDENIPSEDEDYNNPDEIDTRLDDIKYIKENSNKEIRPDYFEIKNTNNNIDINYNKKPEYIFEFLKNNLIKSPLFSELSFDILTKCIDALTEVDYKIMNDIIKQDEYSDKFYIIFEGELECKIGFTIVTKEGNRTKVERYDPKLVKVYYPGDYFCELNLLYHIPSRGTIKAITDAKLYTINRQTYKYIINSSLNEKNKNRIEIFKRLPIFETFIDEEFAKLTTIYKEEIFYKGETIIKENEYLNKLMIIEEGKCTGYKTIESGKIPKRIREYKEEDFFGRMSLLKDELIEETIKATSDIVKFISFDRHTINNIFGSLELILMRDIDIYEKYFPPLPDYSENDMSKDKTKSIILSVEGDNINQNNNIITNNIVYENKRDINILENNINFQKTQSRNNENVNILPEKINSFGMEGITQKISKEKEEEYESEIKRLKDEVSLLKNKLENKTFPELNNIFSINETNKQNKSNFEFQNNMIKQESIEKEEANSSNIKNINNNIINNDNILNNNNNIVNNDDILNNNNINQDINEIDNNNNLNNQLEMINYKINQPKIIDDRNSDNYLSNNNNFNTFNINNQEYNNKIQNEVNEINESHEQIEEIINLDINLKNNIDLSNKINNNFNQDNSIQNDEIRINNKTESKNDSKMNIKLNNSQSNFSENRARKSNKFKNLANLNIDNIDNSMRNKTSTNKSIQNMECIQIDSNISVKRKKTNSEVEKNN